MVRSDLGSWRVSRPEDAGRWLAGLTAPWWIAGGWAIDLFAGRTTRAHYDLDVGCFRQDLSRAREALAGWELHEARDGCLTRLTSLDVPDRQTHALWCRPSGAEEWWLELLLEEREEMDWIFRRSSAVRRPVRELVTRAPNGLPYLRPEVQLLYQAKALRPQDEADFRAVAPALDADARAWLCDALGRVHPGHAWLRALCAARGAPDSRPSP